MRHNKRTCVLCAHTLAIVTESERVNDVTGNAQRVFNLTRVKREVEHSTKLADLALKREKRIVERSRATMRAIRLSAYKNESMYFVNTLLKVR